MIVAGLERAFCDAARRLSNLRVQGFIGSLERCATPLDELEVVVFRTYNYRSMSNISTRRTGLVGTPSVYMSHIDGALSSAARFFINQQGLDQQICFGPTKETLKISIV